MGGEGYRVLVDRQWPRGLRKEAAKLDEWAKDLAPSAELLTWFWHDPNKWMQFQARFRDELKKSKRAQAALAKMTAIAREGNLTFVCASRDEKLNAATVLKELVAEALAARP